MFYFFFKVYYLVFFDLYDAISLILLFSGFISVVWGTFAALNQVNIKRLYAYSAIVNVGYLLLALSVGTYVSFVVVVNYLFSYFVSTLALFSVVLMFRKSFDLSKLKLLVEYRYFFSYHVLASTLFSIVFFSLSGIPPLAGFFIKFLLFKHIFLTDFLTSSLFFLILLLSAVATFYYIRCVNYLFFNLQRLPMLFAPVSFLTSFILVNCCVFLLLFLFFQPVIYLFIEVNSINNFFF